MAILSKPKAALKAIMESLGRLDLFERIVKSEGRKQRHDVVAFAFKELSKEIPKDDLPAIRQLYELVANVQDEDLQAQLEAVLNDLYKAEKMVNSPFYKTEPVPAQPFNWKGLHKPATGKSLFSRMFKRGK